jgi:hypothetical protein
MPDEFTPDADAAPMVAAPSAVAPSGYEPPPGYVLTPAVRPARPKTLGLVAFTIAVIVFVATIVVSIVIGIGAIPFTVQNSGGFHYNLDVNSSNPTEAALGVAGLLQVGLGTAFGIWALVQGIVAVAQRRGRAYGVIAIVLAALGPIVTAVVTLITVAVNLPR